MKNNLPHRNRKDQGQVRQKQCQGMRDGKIP